MRATSRLLGYGAPLAILLTVLCGLAWAVDITPQANPADLMKTLGDLGKPGPDHAKLQPLVGSWDYTCKFWLEPGKTALESKGTIERRWVLGGRFLEEKVVGTNFDGKPGFEGLGLLGYDSGLRKFTLTWISSMTTGVCSGLGVVDVSGTLFTYHTEAFCPLEKTIVKGRDELRIENSDRIVMESYRIENGKEIKVMEIVSVRHK